MQTRSGKRTFNAAFDTSSAANTNTKRLQTGRNGSSVSDSAYNKSKLRRSLRLKAIKQSIKAPAPAETNPKAFAGPRVKQIDPKSLVPSSSPPKNKTCSPTSKRKREDKDDVAVSNLSSNKRARTGVHTSRGHAKQSDDTGSQHDDPTQQSESAFPFMKLPPELRHMVYRKFLLVDDAAIQENPDKWGIDTKILQVSQQIHNEASEILKKENCFIALLVEGEERNWFRWTYLCRNTKRTNDTWDITTKVQWPEITAHMRFQISEPSPEPNGISYLVTKAHLARLERVFPVLRSPCSMEVQLLKPYLKIEKIDWPKITENLSQLRGLAKASVSACEAPTLDRVSSFPVARLSDVEADMLKPLSAEHIMERIKKFDLECSLLRTKRCAFAERSCQLRKYDYIEHVVTKVHVSNEDLFKGHIAAREKILGHRVTTAAQIAFLSLVLGQPRKAVDIICCVREISRLFDCGRGQITRRQFSPYYKGMLYDLLAYAYMELGKVRLALSCRMEAIIAQPYRHSLDRGLQNLLPGSPHLRRPECDQSEAESVKSVRLLLALSRRQYIKDHPSMASHDIAAEHEKLRKQLAGRSRETAAAKWSQRDVSKQYVLSIQPY